VTKVAVCEAIACNFDYLEFRSRIPPRKPCRPSAPAVGERGNWPMPWAACQTGGASQGARSATWKRRFGRQSDSSRRQGAFTFTQGSCSAGTSGARTGRVGRCSDRLQQTLHGNDTGSEPTGTPSILVCHSGIRAWAHRRARRRGGWWWSPPAAVERVPSRCVEANDARRRITARAAKRKVAALKWKQNQASAGCREMGDQPP
jgi:hypothetical protein